MINPKFLFLFFLIPNLCFAQIVESFDASLSSEWVAVDAANASHGPSAWSASRGLLRQKSNIRSSTNRLGTFLYYQPGFNLQDVSMQWTQRSDDNDSLGFMFRISNNNDYYRFSTNLQDKIRLLEKNVGGVFTTLAQDNVTYAKRETQTIRIDAVGNHIQVFVNDEMVFDVTDSSHPQGTFAFYSWDNNRTRFDNLVIDILDNSDNEDTVPPPSSDDVPPTISITSPGNGETTMGIVNVTADATDNIGVTGVDFFLDGVRLGDTDTTPPFAISWDTLEETNGVYTLEAQAYDAAGNVGTSTPINGVIDNSSSNAIDIQVTPARTSCVAPCSIFFDATATTADATNRPFHELNYSWNFDDANSGNWAWTGKPRNTATGAVSTHVFEAPGVHNVTLVVRDENGNVATQQTAITIQDPDTFYSETNTYCFSTGSNFTDCPTNLASQHITTSTLQNVNNYVGANRRLLLRRGDTWSTNTGITLSGSGPSVLGAFGACVSPDDRGLCANAPKINVTSNTSSAIASSSGNPIQTGG